MTQSGQKNSIDSSTRPKRNPKIPKIRVHSYLEGKSKSWEANGGGAVAHDLRPASSESILGGNCKNVKLEFCLFTLRVTLRGDFRCRHLLSVKCKRILKNLNLPSWREEREVGSRVFHCPCRAMREQRRAPTTSQ